MPLSDIVAVLDGGIEVVLHLPENKLEIYALYCSHQLTFIQVDPRQPVEQIFGRLLRACRCEEPVLLTSTTG
jgi:hypothetical protein